MLMFHIASDFLLLVACEAWASEKDMACEASSCNVFLFDDACDFFLWCVAIMAWHNIITSNANQCEKYLMVYIGTFWLSCSNKDMIHVIFSVCDSSSLHATL